MKKKLLTWDDLAKFCAENQMYKFSAEDTGYQICVQSPALFSKSENKSTDSTLFGTVKLLHTNTNRNHSNVTKKAAENCMSTIAYKPVLANFCEIDDQGTLDFTSHDMEINSDGSTTYIERQVGCFTATKPYMEYDSEKDRHYIYAEVAIPREYTEASSIIERKQGTKVSAELAVNSMSYDVQNKELLLEDIEVMGVTLLGTNPETGEQVQEGMEGARLDIKDFSTENNSVKFNENEQLIATLQELNKTLAKFNIDTTEEGGEIVEDQNIIEEEVTEASEESVEEVAENSTEEEVTTEEEVSEESTEVTSETEEVEEESVVEENKFAMTTKGVTEQFAVSLNDKQFAVESLINDTYGEQDNDYYFCDVYDDDKYCVMHAWMSGKSYKQSYKCKKDVYSLVGDRVSVYAQYLTEDEIKQLENLKSNYELVSDKLAKYEAEPTKMEILNSEEYSQISETEEFVKLKEQDVHFDMSVEEVQAKADEMLLAFAKGNKIEFSYIEEEDHNIGRKTLPQSNKKPNRYGNLFSK